MNQVTDEPSSVDILDQLNKKFESICGRARSAERGLNLSLQTMGDVLAEIYDFGYELRKNQHLYERFVLANSRQRTPLGKKSRDNSWHPLVHIAFSDEERDEGDLSRYARSMMYILAAKQPGQDTREFIAEHGKLTRFLTSAAEHLRPEGDDPDPSTNSPTPPPAVGAIIPVIGSPISPTPPHVNTLVPGSTQLPVSTGSLSRLYTALRGLRGLTDEEFVRAGPREPAVASRAFILMNTARGCSVTMVARKRTFVCGEAHLRSPLPELEDTAFCLDDASAKWFIDHFSASPSGWLLEVDDTEARFRNGHGLKVTAKPLKAVPNYEDLRCVGFLVRRSASLDMTHVQARTVDRWRRKRADWLDKHRSRSLEIWHLAEQRRQFTDGYGSPESSEPIRPIYGPFRAAPMPPMPTMFDLRYQNGEVQVGYFNQMRIAGAFLRNEYMVLARASAPMAFQDGRWLKQEDVRKLRRTLMDCPQGARAWFVDGEIPQCALVVEGNLESVEFRAVFPLANTLTGDRAPACVRLADKALIPLKPFSLEAVSSESNSSSTMGPTRSGAELMNGPGPQSDSVVAVEDQFGAYIISFRPEDEEQWQGRRANFLQQLDWWIERDVTINLLLSGWSDVDRNAFNRDGKGILDEIEGRYGEEAIQRVAGQPLITNRIACLERFYSSTHDWGIMMDDDAILETKYYDEDRVTFFDEMARKGPEAYDGVDVFFPFWDKKPPFDPRAFWKKEGQDYISNHIFGRNPDLKGSLFVVRNFRKQGGQAEVFPDAGYLIHGEDTLFATEAIAKGYTVMMTANIILKEFEGPSFFGEQRKANMRIAHERIASMYQHLDLKMLKPLDPTSKTLGRRKFFKRCWTKPKSRTVPKP